MEFLNANIHHGSISKKRKRKKEEEEIKNAQPVQSEYCLTVSACLCFQTSVKVLIQL